METTLRTMSVGFLGALVAVAGTAFAAAGAQAAPRVSGPYQHHNLAVYLVHGPDESSGEVLTLDAALAAEIVVVHETGDVNQLAVENISREQSIFLQAGDIVKGGKQDRTLGQDLVLKPRSGKVPVAAFCVERGRWSARGSEATDSFASSKHALSSKELKLAARRAKSQQEVWNEVSKLQRKLSEATGATIASAESSTSLQLSLENEQLAETRKAYVDALAKLPERHGDARGFAVSVNGAISSAEVYASAALFRQLWPKLLDAAATEAIAEIGDGASAPAAPKPTAVGAFLSGAEAGADVADGRPAADRSEARETDAAVFYESRVARDEDSWIHRSYIAK